jgi:hypothetical protein
MDFAPEPKEIMTEDGYTFTRQPDGSYTDGDTDFQDFGMLHASLSDYDSHGFGYEAELLTNEDSTVTLYEIADVWEDGSRVFYELRTRDHGWTGFDSWLAAFRAFNAYK